MTLAFREIARSSQARSNRTKYTYDRRNRISSWERAGTTKTFGYDELGNLTHHGVSGSGASNQTFAHPTKPHAISSQIELGTTYGYDADGNRTSATNSVGTKFFTYDSANRLVCQGSSPGTCGGMRAGYDSSGGRIVEFDYTGQRRVFMGDSFNLIGGGAEWQIKAFGETIAYKYDDSVTLRTELPWAWPTIHLRGAPVPVSLLVYAFFVVGVGSLGVRWGLLHPISHRPATAGATWVLVFLIALPPTPASAGGGGGGVLIRRWLVTDQVGSGVVWLDQDGVGVRHTEYAPFGAVAEEFVNGAGAIPRYFGGHQNDDTTGYHYMQARWQDPATGTFTSADPLVAQVDDPQSLNAYIYARGNPVNFTDPDGRCATVWDCTGWPAGNYGGTVSTPGSRGASGSSSRSGPSKGSITVTVVFPDGRRSAPITIDRTILNRIIAPGNGKDLGYTYSFASGSSPGLANGGLAGGPAGLGGGASGVQVAEAPIMREQIFQERFLDPLWAIFSDKTGYEHLADLREKEQEIRKDIEDTDKSFIKTMAGLMSPKSADPRALALRGLRVFYLRQQRARLVGNLNDTRYRIHALESHLNLEYSSFPSIPPPPSGLLE